MGFLYGFIGALLGAVIGIAAAFLYASSATDGDGFGIFFTMFVWGPVGFIGGIIFGTTLSRRALQYVKGNQEGKYAKRNNVFVVASLALAAPALAVAMAWKGEQCQYPPSDQQLLSNFYFHRRVFDKLAQMKQADKRLTRIGDDWIQPDDPKKAGVSFERIGEYRLLLKSAGVHRGLTEDGLNGTDFTCWEIGGATSSDKDKGYAYLSVPPKHIVDSLDPPPLDGLYELESYRHIEGCWYLYYDYLPG